MPPANDESAVAVDNTPGLSVESASQNATLHRSSSVGFDETIHRPGAVTINVAGAFITEDAATATPVNGDDEAAGIHDNRDIRLPHHNAVVSHVAVDVLLPCVAMASAPDEASQADQLTRTTDRRLSCQVGIFLPRT